MHIPDPRPSPDFHLPEIYHNKAVNMVFMMGNHDGRKIWLYHPMTVIDPERTAPNCLVAGTASRTELRHMSAPTKELRLLVSKGNHGNVFFKPWACSIAVCRKPGVGEKGRRAWPPTISWNESMPARMCDDGCMIDGLEQGANEFGRTIGIAMV